MKPSMKKALIDFVQNSAIVLIELILSLVSGSFGALTNTFHDLTDCSTSGIGLLTPKIQKDKTRSYSVLCLVVTSAFLLVASGVMLTLGIQKIAHPSSINGWVMFVVALIGVLFNGMLVLKNKDTDTLDLHVLEDVIGWIVVLAVSMMVALFHWYILDGIMTMLLALYYIFHIGRNLFDVFLVLTSTTTETIAEQPCVAELTYTPVEQPMLMQPIQLEQQEILPPTSTIVVSTLEEDAVIVEEDEIVESSTEESLDTFAPQDETMDQVVVKEDTKEPIITTDYTHLLEDNDNDKIVEDIELMEEPTIIDISTDQPEVTTQDNLAVQEETTTEEIETDILNVVDEIELEVEEIELEEVVDNNQKVHGKLSSIMGNLDNLLANQAPDTATKEESLVDLIEEEEESVVTDEYLQALFDNIIARKEERLRNKQSN